MRCAFGDPFDVGEIDDNLSRRPFARRTPARTELTTCFGGLLDRNKRITAAEVDCKWICGCHDACFTLTRCLAHYLGCDANAHCPLASLAMAPLCGAAKFTNR